MFLKELKIKSEDGLIRNVVFRKGLNLIVDESSKKITGNNIGKTTVLKLIDFCLGKKPNSIYVDPENKKEEYSLVKDFLMDKKVLITLVLKEDLDQQSSREVVIKRNFLKRSNKIQTINGEQLTANKEFRAKLGEELLNKDRQEKPSFRQIISHNIRYEDHSLKNTLKTLNSYTSNVEYETLYLYLLGCDYREGDQKQEILTTLNQEINYKRRLEKSGPKTAYQTRLSILTDEIEEIEKQKSNLNINESFEEDLNKLNQVKGKINQLSSKISRLEIKRDLIIETIDNLNSKKSEIDIEQLHLIYNQAEAELGELQKSFDDLYVFHNRMLEEKIKYVEKELPILEKNINESERQLDRLLIQESELSAIISKSDSFDELEDIISILNEKYRLRGELESTIEQIEEVEKNISEYEDTLSELDDEIFSEDFESVVRSQVNKFNKHFARISSYLYGEKYALNYVIDTNRKGQKLYKFSAFNTNLSTGKKQGEITSFDIAYILFADDENIDTLRFLLNDKKELMDDNQLIKIKDLVEEYDIQFVASILKDKLPPELNDENYFVLQLSDQDKLFRIENN